MTAKAMSAAHDLVITITGTNDVPTIDGATNPAPILEVAGDSSAQNIPRSPAPSASPTRISATR